jgi:hypothetical protein
MWRRGGFVPLGSEDPARSNMSFAWAPVDRSYIGAPRLRSVGKEACEPQGVWEDLKVGASSPITAAVNRDAVR